VLAQADTVRLQILVFYTRPALCLDIERLTRRDPPLRPSRVLTLQNSHALRLLIFPSSPNTSMPSRKKAQSGRIGHHKDRRHSSTERVNTARADAEHCNVALQQINAVDDLPALDAIEFSATESPTLRRLQHLAYELSEGPAVNQPHIPLFQRPKSSVLLPRDEGFTFRAHQDRQIKVSIGRQQQRRPDSPTEKSGQETQSAEKANETPDVVPPKEKHRYVAELNTFEPKLRACALALYLLNPLILPKSSQRTLPLQFG
jgi:hypothetical protein